MRVVETKKYEVITDTADRCNLMTASVVLENILNLFDMVQYLSFNEYDTEFWQDNSIVVYKEDVKEIKMLLLALLANEVEGID